MVIHNNLSKKFLKKKSIGDLKDIWYILTFIPNFYT